MSRWRGVKLLLARRPTDPGRRINGISQYRSGRDRVAEASVDGAAGALLTAGGQYSNNFHGCCS